MRTGDMIAVLCEYGDMPMVIRCPGGTPLVVQSIESKGDGEEQQLHVGLGYLRPLVDSAGWAQDATGL